MERKQICIFFQLYMTLMYVYNFYNYIKLYNNQKNHSKVEKKIKDYHGLKSELLMTAICFVTSDILSLVL